MVRAHAWLYIPVIFDSSCHTGRAIAHVTQAEL